MIKTEVHIAATPAQVRDVIPALNSAVIDYWQLLDFSKYPEWHTSFIKLLKSNDETKALKSLLPGDKIQCDIDGMKFTAEIKENSDSLFQWQGPPVYGLIAGLHSFHMEPSDNGSSTIFKQTEEFSGPISFLMNPSLLGKKMLGQFDQFNKDLKARAEALK
ncbi:hypothetical protein ASPBRDRAFT_27504 [Aspergillus brasiliensis CBS 101740]|uniref:Coenzyme Q-binding protein COQ10 START domain-containing protein n=1 Tax=Aspergillus brasiliensis (strain CBS 101740 / IMI 381727 / IBT 21946) TaxID=767769 RepID=A0A1L9USD3_ASPBC|nr:hypothetical protein ASPBRDRAFT_27504 [Aspergillus brasiliensis CBS 101740]